MTEQRNGWRIHQTYVQTEACETVNK